MYSSHVLNGLFYFRENIRPNGFFLPEKLEFSRHEEWPMRQSESVIGLKWSRWGQETA